MTHNSTHRYPPEKQKRTRTYMDTKTCTQMFIGALFTIAKRMEWPSGGEWVDRVCYVHTLEYCSAMDRNELQIGAIRWMNLENMRSERSQSQKTTLCGSIYVKC